MGAAFAVDSCSQPDCNLATSRAFVAVASPLDSSSRCLVRCTRAADIGISVVASLDDPWEATAEVTARSFVVELKIKSII